MTELSVFRTPPLSTVAQHVARHGQRARQYGQHGPTRAAPFGGSGAVSFPAAGTPVQAAPCPVPRRGRQRSGRARAGSDRPRRRVSSRSTASLARDTLSWRDTHHRCDGWTGRRRRHPLSGEERPRAAAPTDRPCIDGPRPTLQSQTRPFTWFSNIPPSDEIF